MHAYIHVCIHVSSSALFLFVNYNGTLETQYFRIVGHWIWVSMVRRNEMEKTYRRRSLKMWDISEIDNFKISMNLKTRIKIRVKSELFFNIEMSLFPCFERPYKIAVKVGKPTFSG